MSNSRSALAPLILLSEFGGDWVKYLEAIYGVFKVDFLDSIPYWRGERVSIKRDPIKLGLEAGFWHMITEGKIEDERTPDLRRCERIRWPRPILDETTDDDIRIWVEQRQGQDRVHIWVVTQDYVVILAQRNGYCILWTTFLAEEPHKRRKLNRRFEDATKS